jgi:hypothetical protein
MGQWLSEVSHRWEGRPDPVVADLISGPVLWRTVTQERNEHNRHRHQQNGTDFDRYLQDVHHWIGPPMPTPRSFWWPGQGAKSETYCTASRSSIGDQTRQPAPHPGHDQRYLTSCG